MGRCVTDVPRRSGKKRQRRRRVRRWAKQKRARSRRHPTSGSRHRRPGCDHPAPLPEALMRVAHPLLVRILCPAGAVRAVVARAAPQAVASNACEGDVPVTPPWAVVIVRAEPPRVDPRDAHDRVQPQLPPRGLGRIVPPAEPPRHHIVAVGKRPRSVGSPAPAPAACPPPSAWCKATPSARWAVAARAVERVPAEEKVVWPVRVAGAEAMRARSPSDGEGHGLSTGQAPRPSVALVLILEVEPAHVAPGEGASGWCLHWNKTFSFSRQRKHAAQVDGRGRWTSWPQ